jgi:hypothetical protein
MKRAPIFRLVLPLFALGIASCQSTTKRAYCGLYEVGRDTVLVPDSPRLQSQISVWTASSGCTMQGSAKPQVVLLSVSSDLKIVDAVPVFSASGGRPNTTGLRGAFVGGKAVRADLGSRQILPK